MPFYFKTEEQQGGANSKGRWYTYISVTFYRCPSETAREKAKVESPKRNPYTGHHIFHTDVDAKDVPKPEDADGTYRNGKKTTIVDLSNLYPE